MAAVKKKTVQYISSNLHSPKITHLFLLSLVILIISAQVLVTTTA